MRIRPSIRNVFGLALPTALALAAALAAQDGDLDPTFGGGDGKFLVVPAGGGRATAIAARPDDVLVVAGQVDPPSLWGVTLRDSLGAPVGGIQFDFAADGATGASTVHDVLVDDQGRIWVAGAVAVGGDAYRPALARLNSTGDLDNGFGGDGRIVGPAPPSGWAIDFVDAALVLADGRSLFAGACGECLGAGTHGAFVVRLTAAGAADPGFSGDGWFAFAIPGFDYTFVNAITPAAAGAILVAGQTSNPNVMGYYVRVTSVGALDVGFGGGDGISELVASTEGTPQAIAFDPDTGKVVLARGAGIQTAGAALLGFNPSGAVDTNFGAAGVLDWDLEEGTRLDTVEFQTDGKIVAAGTIDANGTQPAGFFLGRAHANGTPDNSFDGNGVKRVEFDRTTEAEDHAFAATLSGGRFVVAGLAEGLALDDAFAVLRLTNRQIFSDGFERATTLNWTSDTP